MAGLISDIGTEQTTFNEDDLLEIEDNANISKYAQITHLRSAFKMGSIKSISDAAYTVGDFGLDTGVKYDTFIFTSLTTDRALNLPTLADNQGYVCDIINLDGSYNVDVIPEGAEDINDWNSTFEITEKYGHVRVMGLSDRWYLVPLNDACVYEISSETADTGLALDGTWDDVSGMTLLNGVYGKGTLEAYANIDVRDNSNVAYLDIYFGIGKTSGNNAPNILGAYDYTNFVQTIANTLVAVELNRKIKCDYESDGSTIYMKSKAQSNIMNISTHTARGTTNAPMFIKFYRRY